MDKRHCFWYIYTIRCKNSTFVRDMEHGPSSVECTCYCCASTRMMAFFFGKGGEDEVFWTYSTE